MRTALLKNTYVCHEVSKDANCFCPILSLKLNSKYSRVWREFYTRSCGFRVSIIWFLEVLWSSTASINNPRRLSGMMVVPIMTHNQYMKSVLNARPHTEELFVGLVSPSILSLNCSLTSVIDTNFQGVYKTMFVLCV